MPAGYAPVMSPFGRLALTSAVATASALTSVSVACAREGGTVSEVRGRGELGGGAGTGDAPRAALHLLATG